MKAHCQSQRQLNVLAVAFELYTLFDYVEFHYHPTQDPTRQYRWPMVLPTAIHFLYKQ